ncbi:DUF11 domain-containing protein [Nocardiopsis sp. CNT312]|uniref:DUF11 domain-containing protein n=1 Tax=Nocardiopsis sp. CNT312 TaxID=1137268 RepID=UPI00048D066B|nr:DUF11 domain-containing protein [Nocardiopsis sp. CNT312]
MAVRTALSAVGLAFLSAVLAAPPDAAAQGEVVPGAGTLHVVVAADTAQPLEEGDRVAYTIRMRNSGGRDLPEARAVQFLPPEIGFVSASSDPAVEGDRAEWAVPLGPGERAVIEVTGEVVAVPEDGRSAATVCLRPAPEAALAACSSARHTVRTPFPPVWVAGGAGGAVLGAAAAALLLRQRRSRRPTPEEPGESGPGGSAEEPPEPDPEAGAVVYHLHTRR